MVGLGPETDLITAGLSRSTIPLTSSRMAANFKLHVCH